ncbi:MAG: hypothetical protein EOS76_14850 [Mesorhizobium sp.]|uniref:hypothetical protein n=1 Tax=unclassified Mesorhizobium TaxID=325217 RepID=UPI000F75FAD2|nr:MULTISPECIES: hypothetical protein [unclassified Mesorhizobium]AZO38637.1 hypothetical protein EJ072_32425 [Mesorhizobium sp. M2A.F.Ca.ET.046.03.2.1]RVC70027.1 hypothetical protein EN766_28510 [Mesorhizobium sp. M2A.F.Ca.ET.046.02.1.1]RWB37619.1 MAG: hypothetical protein EOQ44_32825 [Mesorhizobium sp.]RWE18787.1 MAG: hypothetical protein EOS76_14850 [Mesorhizobium sp.]
MTFPNPTLGPFEAENNDWAQHVASGFVSEITREQLASPGCDPAHAAMAHLAGFVICAMSDAGKRGDGRQQIMPDLLEEVTLRLKPLFAGTIGVTIRPSNGPLLTVVPGGKPDDAA